MPSIITGIIGGVQGSSAAHNAANAQVNGYNQAAADLWKQVDAANQTINGAANTYGPQVEGAGATSGGWAAGAADRAATGMNNATTAANTTLSPYVTNGNTASNNLSNLTSAGFKFDPSNLENTPGYQFALQQGQKSIDNQMASRGLANSGEALKAGANYAENLAQNTYQQAFNNALSTYNTNVTSLLPQASMGMTASNLTAGNLMQAAQYSGNTGIQSSEYAGNANLRAAEYAGNAGLSAANNIASNMTNFGVYQGNGAANSGAAIANGDINAANAWNGTLSSIGSGLTPLAMAGFGTAAQGGGWNVGNIGPNMAGMLGLGLI